MPATRRPRRATLRDGMLGAECQFGQGFGVVTDQVRVAHCVPQGPVHNVLQRIRFLFGDGYGIVAESEPGVYTRVTMTIPLIRRDEA